MCALSLRSCYKCARLFITIIIFNSVSQKQYQSTSIDPFRKLFSMPISRVSPVKHYIWAIIQC